jgi:hypothetical protein
MGPARSRRRRAVRPAALDHPGIVTVHSVEEADGVHLLTMQLVDGQPLDTLIHESWTLEAMERVCSTEDDRPRDHSLREWTRGFEDGEAPGDARIATEREPPTSRSRSFTSRAIRPRLRARPRAPARMACPYSCSLTRSRR